MALTVTVPATTANLGPGFDCLGAALTLYNQFAFSLGNPGDPPLTWTIAGKAAAPLTVDPDNVLYRAIDRAYQELNQPQPPIKVAITMGVPLARGLGSSATAIVGGLVGANALAGNLLSIDRLMALAIELEGHPDNVVPALLGGCRLAATGAAATPTDPDWQICPLDWHPTVAIVVAIPAFELSTEKARQVLPQSYSRADAIFNVAHGGLLLQGLATGHGPWLRSALQDRIHQPYRLPLIPGFAAVQSEALAAGAYGVVISGAGPTLLALTAPDRVPAVIAAMAQAWSQEGISAQVMGLDLDRQGAWVEAQEPG